MRRLLAVVLLAAIPVGDARADEPGRSGFTLPNGLRVRLVPGGEGRDVVVLLGIRAGFLAEPAGKPQLAHVAEHMVIFGGRPGSDEARATDRWFAEGRVNGETHLPFLYFDLHGKTDELAMALRMQAARLGGPGFDPDVLAREVPRTLAEVDAVDRLDEGYTAKFASAAFVQAALRGTTEIRLRETSRALRADDVRAFWGRAARTDRAILCVVGAFDPAEARKVIEASFGAIRPPAGPPEDPPAALRPGRIEATWDLRARHLLIAWPAPKPTDPDHPALTVAALALMQRLFAAPEVAALAKLPIVGNDADGLFLIKAYVRPGADVGALEAAILDRVARLSAGGAPDEAEVAALRVGAGQMLGFIDAASIPLPPGLSRSAAGVNIELQRLIKELSWGDPVTYKARLDAVSARSVRDAAARHLVPGAATIVRLGPAR